MEVLRSFREFPLLSVVVNQLFAYYMKMVRHQVEGKRFTARMAIMSDLTPAAIGGYGALTVTMEPDYSDPNPALPRSSARRFFPFA
jgi:hypothetical protein